MAKPLLPPRKKQPTVCNRNVREGSVIKDCGEKYLTESCPKRDSHMFPMVTGFCHSGWHEGNKIPMPTCKEYLLCPCKAPGCHDDLWMMFEMSGNERIPVNNSTWRPGRVGLAPVGEQFPDDFTQFLAKQLQDPEVKAAYDKESEDISSPTPARARPTQESPAPGIVPPREERTFAPTKDGRAGRGELELWVQEVTDIWVVERDNACTPQYISEQIGRIKGFKPPSTGAITNVILRWAEIGFCTFEEKPRRFTGYTEDGVRFGLDSMKRRAKSSK